MYRFDLKNFELNYSLFLTGQYLLPRELESNGIKTSLYHFGSPFTIFDDGETIFYPPEAVIGDKVHRLFSQCPCTWLVEVHVVLRIITQ